MIIKNIANEIQETLKARERALARKTTKANEETEPDWWKSIDISDMASRTTFVRMISNKFEPVIVAGGEIGTDFFGVEGTPFGFTDSLMPAYKSIPNEGIKPIPGIKDISVEYKGGYKAIREATINWSVNSLSDLDRLTPHFLTIGKVVLLEWGWSTKKNMNKLRSFYKNGVISDEVFTNPMRLVVDNKGDYDALAGTVSNFQYGLNDDGGFDCVTTLVSIGINLFESQKIDTGGADVKIIPKKDGTKSEPILNTDGLVNSIINIERIVFHNYFEVEHNRTAPMTSLNAANLYDYNKSQKDTNVLQHYIPAIDNTKGTKNKGLIEGFSSRRGSGEVIAEEDMWEPADNMSEEELAGREWYDKDDETAPQAVKNLRYSGADSWVKKVGVKQGVKDGINDDAFFTASSFYVDSDYYSNSTDIFVRWGWFEDNILSRYTGYAKELNGEIINSFRSVETVIDKDGNPTGKFRPVLIRNNKNYLLPRNPMKFFLPGQNIKYEAIDFGTNAGFNKDHIGKFLKEFLKVNNKKPFVVDSSDDRYGSLRNIMVNTKEIKKAFGIKPDKANSDGISKIHYSDDVQPPSTVKAGVKRLLSQLNNNFFNFWKFEIVEDTHTGNVKVIDVNASPNLDKHIRGKLYSTFVENSSTLQGAGLYKFPSFKIGSIVRNQDLSFKIPDSMAVTAMYGSNKNKGGGIVIDTSNENSILETVFSNDLGDSYIDERLAGLEKAFQLSEGAHNIGSFSPNEEVRFDGSFQIDSDINKHWWSNWSDSPNPETDSDTNNIVEDNSVKVTRTAFSYEAHLILEGNVDENIEKAKQDNKEIYKQIEAIESDNQNILQTIERDFKTYKILTDEAKDKIAGLRSKLKSVNPLNGKYYTFKHSDKNNGSGYELSLFTAGEAVIKSLLFGYDRNSSIYQANFIIPAELSLTIDGIGGLTPGDIIQTDYIQPKYNATIKDADGVDRGPFTFFQIFNVSQKLNSDGWFTDLTTKMRVNNDVLSLSAGEIMTNIRERELEASSPEKEAISQIAGARFDNESKMMVENNPINFQSGSHNFEDPKTGMKSFPTFDSIFNPINVETTYQRLQLDKYMQFDPYSAEVQDQIAKADERRAARDPIGFISADDLNEILNDPNLQAQIDAITADIGAFQKETELSVSQNPVVKKVAEELGVTGPLTDEDIEESMKNLNVDTSNIEIGTFQKETEYSVSQKTTKENITPDIDQLEEQQAIVVEKQGEDKVIQTVSTTKERRKELLGDFGIVFEGRKMASGYQTQVYEYDVKNSETGEIISTELEMLLKKETIPKKLFRPAFDYLYMEVSGQLAVRIGPKTVERYNIDMKANWPTKDSRGNYIIIYDIPTEVFNYNTSKKDELDKSSYLYQKMVVQAGISEDKAILEYSKRRKIEWNILQKIKLDALSMVKGLVQDGTLT